MQIADPTIQRAETIAISLVQNHSGVPECALVAPSIAVPMHLAIDAAPFSVSVLEGKEPLGLLKLYYQDALGISAFEDIVAASQKAAALGIAPALLNWDKENAALLYQWVSQADYKSVMRSDLDDEATLEAVLAAKSSLHKSSPFAVTRSPFDLVASYLEIAANIKGPNGAISEMKAVKELCPWVEHIGEAFLKAGVDVAPTHGENALSNIFVRADKDVKLVDFDRAVNADPLYDLASFCIEFCAFDEDLDRVLALYGTDRTAETEARLRLYMVVDDFVWGLWGLIEHFNSSRRGTVEFYKYAHNRFLRCGHWLSRWDIGALIREI